MLNSDGRKVLNAAFGLPYTLRAEISRSDGTYTVIKFKKGIKYVITLRVTNI